MARYLLRKCTAVVDSDFRGGGPCHSKSPSSSIQVIKILLINFLISSKRHSFVVSNPVGVTCPNAVIKYIPRNPTIQWTPAKLNDSPYLEVPYLTMLICLHGNLDNEFEGGDDSAFSCWRYSPECLYSGDVSWPALASLARIIPYPLSPRFLNENIVAIVTITKYVVQRVGGCWYGGLCSWNIKWGRSNHRFGFWGLGIAWYAVPFRQNHNS